MTRTTENCRYCWMCRHACPVGRVTAREALTPHAWALLIESVRRGQLPWDRETVDVLYACADCGLCRAHCVTDQALPDAIVEARAAVVAAGVAPPSVYAFQRQKSERARAPSHPIERPPTQVGLFVGESDDFNRGECVDSILGLLQAARITPAEVCRDQSTGLLESSLGLHVQATEAARSVLAELQERNIEELLVTSPADRWTFEYVYPHRLGVPWPATIAIAEVIDVIFGAWSRGLLTLNRRTDAPPYAYHDPCHGPRVGRTGASARALLAATLGAHQHRELFWREQRAHPCGAIGGLTLTKPEIAGALARSRVSDAVSTGARWLITDDPACAAQLAEHATDGIEVHNLYDLLAAENTG